jgi:hypothetical protein
MRLSLPTLNVNKFKYNQTQINFNKNLIPMSMLDKGDFISRVHNINYEKINYLSPQQTQFPNHKIRLSKKLGSTQIKKNEKSLNILLKAKPKPKVPIKQKIFEKIKFNETASNEEDKGEDEYSTLEIGDQVEVYKKYLVKPKRLSVPTVFSENIKLNTDKSKRLIKLSTLIVSPENVTNNDLELVNLDGIIDFRCRRKKEVKENKMLTKIKTLKFKALKIDPKRFKYLNLNSWLPEVL